MNERRVLILCYFYPPLGGGGVHRVLSFTRHLPALGWNCTVVCAGEEDYWVRDDSLVREIPPATEVIRVHGGSALSALMRMTRARSGRRSGRAFGPLRRWSDWWLLPDSYAGWAKRASAVAARRLAQGGIDAVLSSSPPDSVHLAAQKLRRAGGPPWVADFRDPWVGLHFRRPPTAWHRARQQAYERGVLKGADAILAASETHARALEKVVGGSARSRVHHVPNGFEIASPVLAAETSAASSFEPDRFHVFFSGTLSQMPATETFLEGVHEMLKAHPEARRSLRVTLAGPFDEGYSDRAVALGLTGIVRFPGPLPHAATRAMQRAADLLLLWKPRGMPTMVPGKTYEYLDSGRPMLALLEPGDEVATLVERAGAEVIGPEERDPVAASLSRRWSAWKAGAVASAPRPEWLDTYSRGALATRLASVLTQVAERRA